MANSDTVSSAELAALISLVKSIDGVTKKGRERAHDLMHSTNLAQIAAHLAYLAVDIELGEFGGDDAQRIVWKQYALRARVLIAQMSECKTLADLAPITVRVEQLFDELLDAMAMVPQAVCERLAFSYGLITLALRTRVRRAAAQTAATV
jgi:hypothetical protein